MKSNWAFRIELAAIVILAISLAILWTTAFGKDRMDLVFHDSYMVLKDIKEKVWVLPILFLVFCTYLIKEAFYSYQRRFQNLILLTTAFLLNTVSLFIINFVYTVILPLKSSMEWTVYPPLSAIPRKLPPPTGPNYLILSIQIFFLLILVIIAILTGKNWDTKQSES